MFQPHYVISHQLLDTIKRITVRVHELNKSRLSEIVYAELLSEAQVTSTYASTSIEGNPLPITEVRRILKSQPAHLRQSEREVLNYNRTLSMLFVSILSGNPQQPFSTELLRKIHHGVVDGLLPEEQSGQWRQEPVVVHDPRTGGIVFLPPDHQAVVALMDDLAAFVETERSQIDPLLLAGLFHKQFVIIHPFVDGNGRTARLATNLLLAELGINLYRLLSFENYYNQNVARYFQQVGLQGDYYDLAVNIDFTPWLEYFASGILDELLRLEKQLQQQQIRPQTQLLPHDQIILQTIDKNGLITDRDYSRRTERAKATRSLDFKRLITLGLIERKGSGRSTYYQRKHSIA